MQSINGHRDEMKKDFLEPSAELGDLMAQSQEHFAGLLKSGQLLRIGQAGLRADQTSTEREEQAAKALCQAQPYLAPLPGFFEKAPQYSTQDFRIHPSIIDEGKMQSQAVLAIADGSAKPLSLENNER